MVDHRTTQYADPSSLRDTSADGAYYKLIKNTLQYGMYVNYGNHVGSGSTIELRPTKITYPGLKKYITYRDKFNLAFALAEVLWICAGRQDVEMLSFYNKQIASYSDDGETFNAPYGYRIFKKFGDQFQTAIRKLQENPNSRHGVINIWDPEADNEAGHKDYACNNLSQLLIRNEKLEWTQIMRSNDLLWGLPYNSVQFGSLMQIAASILKVDVGGYTHFSNSSHIYADKINEAEELVKNSPVYYDSPPLSCSSYEEFTTLIETLLKVEARFRSDSSCKLNVELLCEDPGWRNLIATLGVATKLKHDNLALAEYFAGFLTEDSFEQIWAQRKIEKHKNKGSVVNG